MSVPAQAPPAGGGQIGSPVLNVAIFVAFVVITLFIVYRVSQSSKTASDYYAAGSSFTGPQNGIAISGDYLSAASLTLALVRRPGGRSAAAP